MDMATAKHAQDSQHLREYMGRPVMDALKALSQSSGIRNMENAVCVLAASFGDKDTFRELLGQDTDARHEHEKKLLNSFQNNLNLLIEKTWVEKADEELKQQVLYRLKLFCSRISDYRYGDSYNDFMEIIHDTVYLMFGPEAKKEDFPEYAIRIDPEFGIFWQYVETLAKKNLKAKNAAEECRLMLLLGMFFLANY
jgi:hypothetical protein